MTTSSKTTVLLTEKKNAKAVKVALEKEGALHKSYRLSSLSSNSLSSFFSTSLNGLSLSDIIANSSRFIAIPVHAKFIQSLCVNREEDPQSAFNLVVGHATQSCRFSSSVLGNVHRQLELTSNNNLNFVQNVLLQAFINYYPSPDKDSIFKMVEKLTNKTVPPKLELMGDDRTLVIPFRALNIASDAIFEEMLHDIIGDSDRKDFMSLLWKNLADTHRSHRVVRRGEIDPNSKVRESGHSILWIDPEVELAFDSDYGPGSRGWITITEQGIKQSFDLTKVMFSRGNVSEKIRFGKLVQPGELVLDMYAGIGYYTLPALVIGHARYVYSCEWNPHAASFLRYNLEQNGVNDRASVLEGDSRVRVKEEHVLDLEFDRISLGLLPSSEGGWETAVKAIRKDIGGWLHIHANVPSHEHEKWALWMCSELSRMHECIYSDDNVWVLCHRIEKVKSFAPKVDHVVADVFIGPQLHIPDGVSTIPDNSKVGIFNKAGHFIESSRDAETPSSALGHGVLDQQWMM